MTSNNITVVRVDEHDTAWRLSAIARNDLEGAMAANSLVKIKAERLFNQGKTGPDILRALELDPALSNLTKVKIRQIENWMKEGSGAPRGCEAVIRRRPCWLSSGLQPRHEGFRSARVARPSGSARAGRSRGRKFQIRGPSGHRYATSPPVCTSMRCPIDRSL